LIEAVAIKALLKYLAEEMFVLAKLVSSHLQSVITPSEHNPNLLAEGSFRQS
jgi:hypothetical protein